MAKWLSAKGWWQLAGISVLASFFMAVATPPEGPAALVWLGWIPLVLVLRVSTKRRARSLFALGWLGGLCSGLIGFTWIGETLERFAHFPAVGAYFGLFVFSAWTAVPFGLWAIGVAKGPQRGWAAYVWPIALWVCVNAVWPSLFPYTPMIGLSQTPEWIQAAELGGVPLVEAQTIIVGILIADAALETNPRRRLIKAAIGIAIPVVSYGLGAWRMAQIDAEAEQGRTVRFGILQPNTALMATTRPEKMKRLWTHSAGAQAEGAQVVIWPEAGIYPFVIERPWERDKAGRRRVLFAHRLPTILGVATRKRRDRYEWNSVVMMNAEGDVTRYIRQECPRPVR